MRNLLNSMKLYLISLFQHLTLSLVQIPNTYFPRARKVYINMTKRKLFFGRSKAKRSPRSQGMPGASSSSAAVASADLDEVLQLLREYLAGRLRHRSHRVPVLHQLRPQLRVAQRVHRHFAPRLRM